MKFWSRMIPALAVQGKISCISMGTEPAMSSDFENMPGKARETVKLVTWYELLFSPHKRGGFDNTPSNLGKLFC